MVSIVSYLCDLSWIQNDTLEMISSCYYFVPMSFIIGTKHLNWSAEIPNNFVPMLFIIGTKQAAIHERRYIVSYPCYLL